MLAENNSDLNTSLARIPHSIASQLRSEIGVRFKVGDRLPTVMELAARFSVSKHSVSTALEILARERLIEKSPGRGIRIANGHVDRWVGIVSEMDLLYPSGSSYFPQLVTCAREFLEEKGLTVDVYLGRSLPWESRELPSCDRFVRDLKHRRLSGVMVANAPFTENWIRLLGSAGVPVVGASFPLRIQSDVASIVTTGLRQLAAQGCLKVAMLGWKSSAPADLFIETARQLNLKTSSALIRSDLHPVQPGSGWEEFREVWSASSDRPDGLLIMDDALLDEVASTIGQLGISVPDQLRVVSRTHKSPARSWPFPMTLIEEDTAIAARFHVDLLLHQMGLLASPPESLILPFTVRQHRATPARQLRPV